MLSAPQSSVLSFGEFTVDLNERRLLHSGILVPLTPKQFDTLQYMVLNSGRVLPKEELLKALWPDSFVEDSNLSQNVFWLRKAFRNGDGEGAETNFIVTVPGKGYRFDADIMSVEGAKRLNEPQASTVSARFAWWGVGAVVGAILLMTGVLILRHPRPAKPVVSAVTQRNIVLAQLANSTGDPALTGPLTAVLRIGLGQSPFLVTLPRSQAVDTLRAMRLPADSPLTPELAAQICQRHHFTAVVAAGIAAVGSTYILTLDANDCVTGRSFSSGRAVVHRKEEILTALDGLLPELRTRLGESIPSVKQYSISVEQTTTASLDAFEAFSAGDDLVLHGGWSRAMPLYEKAIALDPNFAMAYARLGGAYAMQNNTAKMDEYITRAYQLSGSISPREKLFIEQTYIRRVTMDLDASIRLDQQESILHPLSQAPLQGLCDTFVQVGRFADAVHIGEEGLQRFPDDAVLHIALARAYLRSGNLDAVKRVADDADKRHMEGWDLHELMWNRAVLIDDQSSEAAERRWVIGKTDEYQALDDDAFLNLRRGRATQAQASQRACTVMARSQSVLGYADVDVGNFAFALEEMGLHEEANRLIHSYVPSAPSPEIARGLAAVGDVRTAEALGAKLQRTHPKDTLVNAWSLPIMRASMDLREPNSVSAQRAIEALKPAEPLAVRDFAAPYMRGKAYLQLGNLKAAQSEFLRIVDTPGADAFSPLYPLALLELARTQSRSRDLAASKRTYQKLFSLWQQADPTMPVLVQARRELASIN